MEERILQVKNLITKFETSSGFITAVDDVSFEVKKGKTLGIVGESGSGKSVTALSVMRLVAPPIGKIDSGSVIFEGKDLLQVSEDEMRDIRGNKISMIFQEPMTSLNPVFTVGEQIREVLILHQKLSFKEASQQAIDLLTLVGIPAPELRVKDYPHQLSGGMRQRVMIAIALACRPSLLIADEPTTALDVTIQAQVLDLMNKLQKEIGMGLIMITHDLGVVAETCDEVAVMYCGRIIEQASVHELFQNPQHPYTKGLLASMPHAQRFSPGQKKRLTTIKGVVPSPLALPAGCNFQDRCDRVQDNCKGGIGDPLLEEKNPGHFAACFYPCGQSKTNSANDTTPNA